MCDEDESLAAITDGQLQQQQKRVRLVVPMISSYSLHDQPARTQGAMVVIFQELRELKLQAKRAGKKAQQEHKQLQADMLARHAAELQANKSLILQHGQTPSPPEEESSMVGSKVRTMGCLTWDSCVLWASGDAVCCLLSPNVQCV